MDDYQDKLEYILADSEDKLRLLDEAERIDERRTVEELTLNHAMRTVFATKEGALVFRFLMESTQAFSPLFSAEPRYSAYLEGRRAIGFVLLKHLADMDRGLLISLLNRDEVELPALIKDEG